MKEASIHQLLRRRCSCFSTSRAVLAADTSSTRRARNHLSQPMPLAAATSISRKRARVPRMTLVSRFSKLRKVFFFFAIGIPPLLSNT